MEDMSIFASTKKKHKIKQKQKTTHIITTLTYWQKQKRVTFMIQIVLTCGIFVSSFDSFLFYTIECNVFYDTLLFNVICLIHFFSIQ